RRDPSSRSVGLGTLVFLLTSLPSAVRAWDLGCPGPWGRAAWRSRQSCPPNVGGAPASARRRRRAGRRSRAGAPGHGTAFPQFSSIFHVPLCARNLARKELSQKAGEGVDSFGASAPKVRRCYPVCQQEVTPLRPQGSAPTNCPLLSTALY